MIGDVLKKRLQESIGIKAEIFLHNGFRYYGTITNCDEKYLEIRQEKNYKIIELIDISDATVEVVGK